MIDTTTEVGQRVARRLHEDRIAWLTTVNAKGTPVPAPVWFLYEGEPGRERILVYGLNSGKRNENLRANPRVAIHLNCSEDGEDVVILTGTARIATELPAPPQNPAYLERYGEWIAKDWASPEKFAEEYGLPLEITNLRLRAW